MMTSMHDSVRFKTTVYAAIGAGYLVLEETCLTNFSQPVDPTYVREWSATVVMQQQPMPAEKPRTVEPEIIPPGGREMYSGRLWVAFDGDRVVHVRIARPALLGLVVALLLIGAASVALLLMTGIAVIGVVAASVLIYGATLSGLLRRLFRQYRAPVDR
jgi:hypothetical protein